MSLLHHFQRLWPSQHQWKCQSFWLYLGEILGIFSSLWTCQTNQWTSFQLQNVMIGQEVAVSSRHPPTHTHSFKMEYIVLPNPTRSPVQEQPAEGLHHGMLCSAFGLVSFIMEHMFATGSYIISFLLHRISMVLFHCFIFFRTYL